MPLESIDDSAGLITNLPNQQAGGIASRATSVLPVESTPESQTGYQAFGGEAEGLTPGERGGVLHEALKHLFSSLKNSDQINALTAVDREVLIEAAADEAVRGLKAPVREE